MCGFNVGDRVEICAPLRPELSENPELMVGSTGTVCFIDECYDNEREETGFDEIIGVEWDIIFRDPRNSTSCKGHCNPERGWYVYQDEIKLIGEDDEINEDDLASYDDLLTLIGCK